MIDYSDLLPLFLNDYKDADCSFIYDYLMSLETEDWKTYDSVYDKVLKLFNNNITKTEIWFKTSNPLLGGFTPNQMVIIGRMDHLNKWIDTQIEENEPCHD